METNGCDVDAHLPPRKRLLAGFKRQSPDDVPSASISSWSEYSNRLNSLLRAQLSDLRMSNADFVEYSKLVAVEATRVAEVARANAEEKAEKAAKAKAAAKRALELVATISEKTAEMGKKCVKKDWMKKQVPVQALYSKKKGKTKCKPHEKVASNLHRVIHSSLKNADMKKPKQKRPKSSMHSGKALVSSGIPFAEGSRPSMATRNDNVVAEKIGMITVDLNTVESGHDDQPRLDNGKELQSNKTDQLQSDNSELETLPSKDKSTESSDIFGKKRGRSKQKKLPLSVCSLRDETGSKQERKSRATPQSGDKTRRTTAGSLPLVQVGPSGNTMMLVERTNMWKCQAFNVPACVKQNKVVQP